MSEPRVAVLIDADNISGDNAELVLEEAGKQGRVIIRRIYGDWTAAAGKKWKKVLADLAIVPIQQFQNTVGKNATDSALIIDAMDLLHRDAAECFCIVSSDADFTRLASRIREDAKVVVGVGARTTPRPFVRACDRFIFLENLRGQKDPPPKPAPRTAQVPEVRALLDRAYDDAENDDGWAFLGTLGSALSKLDPAFDARTYGYRKLVDLVRDQAGYTVAKHPTKNARTVTRDK